MSPGLIDTDAIILKTFTTGESDQIVTLYSLAAGKVRALAKGAKRSQKRFMNCLDPLGHVVVGLAERRGGDLLRLDNCRLIHRPVLTTDLLRFGLGGLALEIILQLCPEGEPEAGVFNALRRTLAALEHHPAPLELALAFEFKVLFTLGYGPNFEACLICRRPLERIEGAGFDLGAGGLVCSGCRPNQPGLSLGAIKTVRLCQRLDAEALDRVRFPARETADLFGQTARYLQGVAGREIRSLVFLDKVGGKV